MKKFWLTALTASCLLMGSVAHAGDHYRDHGDRGDRGGRGGYEHYDHGRDRDWGGRRGWAPPPRAEWYGYRPIYRPIGYSPVYYPPAPVYYGPPVYRGYDRGDVHAVISVGF